MSIEYTSDFAALDPFFQITQKGLERLVDGAHFFDLLAADAVFEFVISVPSYPRRVVARQAVADLYRAAFLSALEPSR
jgi:uncharacterized protein